jgi:hypothetical protein
MRTYKRKTNERIHAKKQKADALFFQTFLSLPSITQTSIERNVLKKRKTQNKNTITKQAHGCEREYHGYQP